MSGSCSTACAVTSTERQQLRLSAVRSRPASVAARSTFSYRPRSSCGVIREVRDPRVAESPGAALRSRALAAAPDRHGALRVEGDVLVAVEVAVERAVIVGEQVPGDRKLLVS